MDEVFVEKFATFNNFGQGWTVFVWDSQPDGKYYRLKIRVPHELLGQSVSAEVLPAEEQK